MFPKYLDKGQKVLPSSVTPQVDMTDLVVNRFSREEMLEILENSGRTSVYLVTISKGKFKESVYLHKKEIRERTFDENQVFSFSGLSYSGFFIFVSNKKDWEKYACFAVKLSPVAIHLLDKGSYKCSSLINHVYTGMDTPVLPNSRFYHKNQFVYNMRPKVIQINTNIRPIVRNMVSVGENDPSWYVAPSSDSVTLDYDERTCLPKKIIFHLKYGVISGYYKLVLPEMKSCQNILLDQSVRRSENYATVANGLFCRYGGREALAVKVENEILIL